MIKRIILLLLVLSAFVYADVKKVHNGDFDAADTAAGSTWTSSSYNPADYCEDGKFNGLLTLALDYDSTEVLCANDLFAVYIDYSVDGIDWIASDSLTWYNAVLDTGWADSTRRVGILNKTWKMVAFVNPTPTSTIPTSIKNLGYDVIRFRIYMITGVQGDVRLTFKPY